MKILGIETSANACSAALLEGVQENFSCVERFEIAPRQHTQLILPMIDSVLGDVDVRQVDALAFGCGPGAFTGIRVGTGVIQAISYGADRMVAPISSLAAIAQGFYRVFTCDKESPGQVKKILVANDARMDEIYFGAYELSNGFMTLKGIEQVVKPGNLALFLQQQSIQLDEDWYLVGNGWTVYASQLAEVTEQCRYVIIDDNFIYPHARDIAYLAFKKVAAQELVKAEQVSPVYLRNNVAKKPKQV